MLRGSRGQPSIRPGKRRLRAKKPIEGLSNFTANHAKSVKTVVNAQAEQNRVPEPLPGQPISLRTLGEYLNLSPATISLVLNNAPGVRSIPQDTRDRVTEAAAKFDYRPSFYARSLRKRQTFSVGVLTPDLNDNYATQVLTGVEDHLIEEGYFYLTASHRRKPDLIEEYPRLLLDRCVEGFILIDTLLEHSLKVPVVAVAGHKQI